MARQGLPLLLVLCTVLMSHAWAGSGPSDDLAALQGWTEATAGYSLPEKVLHCAICFVVEAVSSMPAFIVATSPAGLTIHHGLLVTPSSDALFGDG